MTNTIINKLFGENIYRKLFLILGVFLQIIVYILSKETSWISLFSGITGIFAVVLCAERNMIYYLFAWPQLISYVYLAYQQKLYGEIYENIFYAITMVIGMIIWYRHLSSLKDNEYKVKAKQLSKKSLYIISILTGFIILCLYIYLNNTDDTQPFMDSITTVPAFVAQILLTFRYREQWIFWSIINVGSIFMWANAHDYCMVAQYIFWTVNCMLGYYSWSKNLKIK